MEAVLVLSHHIQDLLEQDLPVVVEAVMVQVVLVALVVLVVQVL